METPEVWPQASPEPSPKEDAVARIKRAFESSESTADFLKYKNLREKEYAGTLSAEELDELLDFDFQEELRDNPPLEGIFAPKAELNKIKKLPHGEKREALDGYKEKLARQSEALASCRDFIERLILLNNDTSKEKLLGWFDRFGAHYGFSEGEKKIADDLIGKYFIYRKRALDIRRGLPNNLDLVQQVTGVRLGDDSDVSVEVGLMSVDITANAIDGQKIYNKSPEVPDRLEDYGFADYSQHKAPIFYVVINKDMPEATTITHEHEHIKNVILQGIFDKQIGEVIDREFSKQYEASRDEKLKRILLESYFGLKLEQGLRQTKDEIFAIKKEGNPDPDYEDLFLVKDEETNYDYFSEVRDAEDRKDDALWQELAQEFFVKKYKEILIGALTAFNSMESIYQRDGIIAMLADKPMTRWPSAARRLLARYQK